MRAFRLTRSKYPAFSGRGSLLANARWHWAGVPMIYCADSRASAVLETLVHARKDQIPSDYVFYEVDVEEFSIERIPTEALPADWKMSEPSAARYLGTAWIKTLALVIPSVVIPEEHNLLLNPEHPDFPRVRISGPHPFEFDPRLFH
jgi:RES domain-containing protein